MLYLVTEMAVFVLDFVFVQSLFTTRAPDSRQVKKKRKKEKSSSVWDP